MSAISSEKDLWKKITVQVRQEWQDCPESERNWIREHALKLVDLQNRLHQLFLEVGGENICRDCSGECCGHGKFHPTLANLLACFVSEHPLPEPDFEQSCPYIGAPGCMFPPGLRPFNCITFICDLVEDRLTPDDRELFYLLERELNAEYELFASRYAGGSLRSESSSRQ